MDKEAEKKAKADIAAVNKLVAKKEEHIKNFTLCVSPPLESSSFIKSVLKKLGSYGCSIEFRYDSPSNDPALVRWLRNVNARFDEVERIWKPVEPYSRFEATNLIYIRAEDLLSHPSAIEALHSRLDNLKRDLKLTAKHQVFLMIDDMEMYYKRTGKGSRSANASAREAGVDLVGKQKVERQLARLQVEKGCFIVHVEGIEDAAEWIYNITAGVCLSSFSRLSVH